MNSYSIIWTQSALDDLYTIVNFISKYSLTLAEEVAIRVLFRTRQLKEFPFSGQIEMLLQKSKYEYRYIVQRHSKLIYRIENQIIYIERIFDTRQNPKKLKRKLVKK